MEEESLNRILQEDMEAVVNSNCPLSLLENATVLITGASGLLGSQIVKTLACANRLKGLNIRILALIRNEKYMVNNQSSGQNNASPKAGTVALP